MQKKKLKKSENQRQLYNMSRALGVVCWLSLNRPSAWSSLSNVCLMVRERNRIDSTGLFKPVDVTSSASGYWKSTKLCWTKRVVYSFAAALNIAKNKLARVSRPGCRGFARASYYQVCLTLGLWNSRQFRHRLFVTWHYDRRFENGLIYFFAKSVALSNYQTIVALLAKN